MIYPHLCLKKNQEYVKAPARKQATTPDEVNSLVERFEKEYLLMASLNIVAYEDIEEWFMDNGSSCHMNGMRSVFLMFSEIDIFFYVGSGTDNRKTIKWYGYVRFHLE
jgi:hypothetical protein